MDRYSCLPKLCDEAMSNARATKHLVRVFYSWYSCGLPNAFLRLFRRSRSISTVYVIFTSSRRTLAAAGYDDQCAAGILQTGAMNKVNMGEAHVFGGTNAVAGVFIKRELGTEDVRTFLECLQSSSM